MALRLASLTQSGRYNSASEIAREALVSSKSMTKGVSLHWVPFPDPCRLGVHRRRPQRLAHGGSQQGGGSDGGATAFPLASQDRRVE